MRIFYVDDSGNGRLTTFSAIGVPAERWSSMLGTWLRWRRTLRDAHGVDLGYRLHATDWVAGRGRPATTPKSTLNGSKPVRWGAYISALDTLAGLPDLRIMTVGRAGSDRASTYRSLMAWIDQLLRAEDEHGLVVMDGDSDELRTMHTELDIVSRRIVEDPWKRAAAESHWLQAADLVAYAAFQSVARRPERAFMWEWYERCLGRHIVRGAGPGGIRGLDAIES